MVTRIIRLMLALGLFTSVATVAQGAEAPESQEGAIGQTPPRLSFTSGEVSFWRPGAQDWSQAQVNTPLAPGDLLYTGPQGNLEIQIGPRAFVRGGPNTQIGLENHEPDFLQFKVTAGNASFDLRTVEPGRTVEVDTPNAVFTIEHAGYYRVDVLGERTSFIARRGGQATVTSAGGGAVAIEPSEEMIIDGTDSPQVTSYAAPQLDEWDKWNYARTDHLLDAVSARYVSAGVYGVDDLDRYGTWRTVPTYGAIWVPSGVPAGWAPYSTGAWVRDPYYGWTWVDTAPWGWAPYHYGRWVSVNGFWGWAPGPVVVRPAYAPALVAFFGGPGAGVSISIGAVVGWVALGWGEPCVPWWGPASFSHRPWWGGWGGPRIVNNVVIHKTTVVNVEEINVYHNASVKHAVVVVNENHFGRGSIKSARVTQVDVRDLRPIRTAPQVTATPGSFVPTESRGIRPPERVLDRSVVATRPPRSRAESPSGGERNVGPARVPSPAPRIVSEPQKRETAPVPQRPPFGQSKVERRTTDRGKPPAPPKIESRQSPKQAVKTAPPSTSKAKPQTQPGSELARPSPGVAPSPAPRQEAQRPEQASKAAPPPASKTKPQTQPGSEVARPSPGVAPSPAPRQEAQRPEQASKAAPPPVSKAKPQTQPGSEVARPSPGVAPSPARRQEAQPSPARSMPGEPANQISPHRAQGGRPQQRMESQAPPVDRTPGAQETVPRKAPGK
jgi:hypothetical protein